MNASQLSQDGEFFIAINCNLFCTGWPLTGSRWVLMGHLKKYFSAVFRLCV